MADAQAGTSRLTRETELNRVPFAYRSLYEEIFMGDDSDEEFEGFRDANGHHDSGSEDGDVAAARDAASDDDSSDEEAQWEKGDRPNPNLLFTGNREHS